MPVIRAFFFVGDTFPLDTTKGLVPLRLDR